MINESGFQLKPIPDETFFGLVANVGLLLGAETYRDAYSCVTGNGRITPANLLPRNVRSIAPFLPNRYRDNLDVICEEHTAFPYFSAFSLPESKTRALTAMHKKEKLGARSILGLAATSFSEPRFMKHCAACAHEQWVKYRRTTWVRSHQLPAVDVCYRHGQPLIESNISTVKLGIHSTRIYSPNPTEDVHITPNWQAGDPWSMTSSSQLIAQLSHELLFSDRAAFTHTIKGNRYRDMLAQLGWITGTRGLDWGALRNHLIGRYGNFFQRKFGLNLMVDKPPNWVKRLIFDVNGIRHPMYHLIFIGGLFDSFSEVSMRDAHRINEASSARGNNLLPHLSSACSEEFLNPTCISFTDSVVGSAIQEISPSHMAKREVVLAYVKKFPEYSRSQIAKLSRYQFDWLVKYDLSWIDKVLPKKIARDRKREKLRDEKRGLILNLVRSNPKLLRSEIEAFSRFDYEWLMKNDTTWMEGILPKRSDRSRKTLESRRAELIEVIRSNPKTTRTELIKIIKPTYLWLLKNDAEWIDRVRPKQILCARQGKISQAALIRRQQCDIQFSKKVASLTIDSLSSVFNESDKINFAALSRVTETAYRKVVELRVLPETRRAITNSMERFHDEGARYVST